ncbi:hypothetical protein ENSA7_56860 [Enhygromyxa salina]|uniref:Uncharacterized protein n=1 Tax=Enhygromyxa salina TaxID=215803 RepID=A0A2S9YA78_9BACT|nr:hypothetical protein ENSA7_56860 [Enhygromyxa salina]
MLLHSQSGTEPAYGVAAATLLDYGGPSPRYPLAELPVGE